jgi:hypothetical protein
MLSHFYYECSMISTTCITVLDYFNNIRRRAELVNLFPQSPYRSMCVGLCRRELLVVSKIMLRWVFGKWAVSVNRV